MIEEEKKGERTEHETKGGEGKLKNARKGERKVSGFRGWKIGGR